jgi:Ala-tRNA(Pro) deacylase
MPGTLKVSPLTDTLDRAGVAYELLEHTRTERAAAEAEALGLSLHEVAKTIIVGTPEGNVRVVLPASERLDIHKVREFVGGGKETHLLAEEDLVREYPEFELGAVPPVGGPKDRVILDRRLAGRDTFVIEAGAHDQSVRLRPQGLIASADILVEDVCSD